MSSSDISDIAGSLELKDKEEKVHRTRGSEHYGDATGACVFRLILTDDDQQERNHNQGNNHLHLWKKGHT